MLFYLITVLLSLFHTDEVSGIQFYSFGIDKAIAAAKRENKMVFVDTYAAWCAPCKQMDRVFADSDVGTFYNSHFINVKIDMQGPHADQMQNQYEVVWLPTMLIIDQEGQVRNKMDRLLTEAELIELGRSALHSASSSDVSTSLTSDPFSATSKEAVQQDVDPEDLEEVVYVYDERASSGRPHIMYHEAYLHLQLMDGKHEAVVRKYLSTQDNWKTEKNIKFIFDFLNDTRSDRFNFFLANRSLFEQVVGTKRVKETLGMLVSQRLYKGVPRPDLAETIGLFTLVYPARGEMKAYDYYLKRLLSEGRSIEFISLADKYLDHVNPYDHEIIYTYVEAYLGRSDHKDHLDRCLDLMSIADAIEPNNAGYKLTLANVYHLLGQKANAMRYCAEALSIAQSSGIPTKKITSLQKKISGL